MVTVCDRDSMKPTNERTSGHQKEMGLIAGEVAKLDNRESSKGEIVEMI